MPALTRPLYQTRMNRAALGNLLLHTLNDKPTGPRNFSALYQQSGVNGNHARHILYFVQVALLPAAQLRRKRPHQSAERTAGHSLIPMTGWCRHRELLPANNQAAIADTLDTGTNFTDLSCATRGSVLKLWMTEI